MVLIIHLVALAHRGRQMQRFTEASTSCGRLVLRTGVKTGAESKVTGCPTITINNWAYYKQAIGQRSFRVWVDGV